MIFKQIVCITLSLIVSCKSGHQGKSSGMRSVPKSEQDMSINPDRIQNIYLVSKTSLALDSTTDTLVTGAMVGAGALGAIGLVVSLVSVKGKRYPYPKESLQKNVMASDEIIIQRTILAKNPSMRRKVPVPKRNSVQPIKPTPTVVVQARTGMKRELPLIPQPLNAITPKTFHIEKPGGVNLMVLDPVITPKEVNNQIQSIVQKTGGEIVPVNSHVEIVAPKGAPAYTISDLAKEFVDDAHAFHEPSMPRSSTILAISEIPVLDPAFLKGDLEVIKVPVAQPLHEVEDLNSGVFPLTERKLEPILPSEILQDSDGNFFHAPRKGEKVPRLVKLSEDDEMVPLDVSDILKGDFKDENILAANALKQEGTNEWVGEAFTESGMAIQFKLRSEVVMIKGKRYVRFLQQKTDFSQNVAHGFFPKSWTPRQRAEGFLFASGMVKKDYPDLKITENGVHANEDGSLFVMVESGDEAWIFKLPPTEEKILGKTKYDYMDANEIRLVKYGKLKKEDPIEPEMKREAKIPLSERDPNWWKYLNEPKPRVKSVPSVKAPAEISNAKFLYERDEIADIAGFASLKLKEPGLEDVEVNLEKVKEGLYEGYTEDGYYHVLVETKDVDDPYFKEITKVTIKREE